ncbi:hypothetical protein DFH06DRAFT_1336978 [Mycena polygramma]|nr:hypothetical protein DFH06DRAFT_1336978 [Mycena polygramma]
MAGDERRSTDIGRGRREEQYALGRYTLYRPDNASSVATVLPCRPVAHRHPLELPTFPSVVVFALPGKDGVLLLMAHCSRVSARAGSPVTHACVGALGYASCGRLCAGKEIARSDEAEAALFEAPALVNVAASPSPLALCSVTAGQGEEGRRKGVATQPSTSIPCLPIVTIVAILAVVLASIARPRTDRSRPSLRIASGYPTGGGRKKDVPTQPSIFPSLQCLPAVTIITILAPTRHPPRPTEGGRKKEGPTLVLSSPSSPSSPASPPPRAPHQNRLGMLQRFV